VKTFQTLLLEFGSADIPLEKVAEKYFGLEVPVAKKRAALDRLPIKAYRLGSQKSGWLVSAHDLAKLIDEAREEAQARWEKAHRGLEVLHS
jgi:hypothetical protein